MISNRYYLGGDYMDVYDEIILKIVELKKKHKLTQKDIAKKIGSSQPNISKFINNKMKRPSNDFIESLKILLNNYQ